ncbi:MAG: CYTH domain-containing protein [Candidatus Saccharibacteria bacterium]|nr:CYTH domain-containing protein [Candidatus Saccharibacteria bacterium]
MNNEIEASFLDVNKDELRAKLKELGAECVKPEVKMRRRVFDTGPNSYARVRDEGGKIVMTYKNFEDEDSIMGVKEVNLTVNDYNDAIKFLTGCGLKQKADQETYRETWILDGTEITIDTWPWIPSYTEIEGKSEEAVWAVAEKLGFKKEDAMFGAVDKIYNHYYGVEDRIVNHETPVINFEIDPPEWAKAKREQ